MRPSWLPWACALAILLSHRSRAAAQPGQTVWLDAQFLKALKPRCIGPANMSGRITELAVYEKEPRILYVASASGGLWKTANGGTTFMPIFERESTVAVGAVAVAPADPNIVWVGAGEANARNSVSWGDGVYKSTDGGKTWKNMGLRDSHHIGRIVIHPTNPDIVYVAALGHLWGPNRERGLYKTSDGGASWAHIKFIDENTGFIDVAMDPADPQTLYAAAYQVRRDAFSGGNPRIQCGPGGGLYRTGDGGKSWQKMTDGLPSRPLGRCGLTVCRNDPTILYAVIQTDLTTTSVGGQSANLKEQILTDESGNETKRSVAPDDGGIFKSTDKGRTWTYVNSLCPRPFYYGQIRVDPTDANRVYVLGVVLNISKDAGQTFEPMTDPGLHGDHHALWINPRDPQHLILGNDGGVYFSHDRGAAWERSYQLPVAQFYAVGVDMRKPYWVYGGLQDNGTWGGPSATRNPAGILMSDWIGILGYDGYYCQIDPNDPDTVYCEAQYGMLHRVNVRTSQTINLQPWWEYPAEKGKPVKSNIVPPPAKETPTFRFNWCSPIVLSVHDNRTLYFGGNVVFRSTDRGDTWSIISADLSRETPGAKANRGHTITTLAESPLKPGFLYAGSDDGRLHVTRNGGQEWADLSAKIPGLPPERHISRIVASPFSESVAYVTIDRHRNDDRAPYVFKTTDGGATWVSITSNLPAGGPVHVIREDPRNKELLYVGTEFGLFVSIDSGASWVKHPELPTVPVHDLVLHPRDRELVIATHGRGIWILDVRPLQELNGGVLQRRAHLFDVAPVTFYRPYTLRQALSKTFVGENPPYGATFHVYLGSLPRDTPLLTISDSRGNTLAHLKGARTAGLQQFLWDGTISAANAPAYDFPPAGQYTATLRIGQQILTKTFKVEAE